MCVFQTSLTSSGQSIGSWWRTRGKMASSTYPSGYTRFALLQSGSLSCLQDRSTVLYWMEMDGWVGQWMISCFVGWLLDTFLIGYCFSWLFFLTFFLSPRREAGDLWCLPPIWNLRAVGLISLFYIYLLLFFCLVLSLFLSYPFLLLAHFPDFFSLQQLPTLNFHLLKGRLFCVALVSFFEHLEGEYVSWWYMLPYGTAVGLYAFIWYFKLAIIVFVHSFLIWY